MGTALLHILPIYPQATRHQIDHMSRTPRFECGQLMTEMSPRAGDLLIATDVGLLQRADVDCI